VFTIITYKKNNVARLNVVAKNVVVSNSVVNKCNAVSNNNVVPNLNAVVLNSNVVVLNSNVVVLNLRTIHVVALFVVHNNINNNNHQIYVLYQYQCPFKYHTLCPYLYQYHNHVIRIQFRCNVITCVEKEDAEEKMDVVIVIMGLDAAMVVIIVVVVEEEEEEEDVVEESLIGLEVVDMEASITQDVLIMVTVIMVVVVGVVVVAVVVIKTMHFIFFSHHQKWLITRRRTFLLTKNFKFSQH
jgi:hypothetical protein